MGNPVKQARLTMLSDRGLQTGGEVDAGLGAALTQPSRLLTQQPSVRRR